jgi:hypothetical protein
LKRPYEVSERRKQYLQKLKDPRWQKLRLKVLERDEFCCQRCFDDTSTLHVHHRYYVPGQDPWDSLPDSLITLCESCHTEEMEMQPEVDQRLLRGLRSKFFYRDLIGIAAAIEEMPMEHISDVVASVYEWALVTTEVQRTLIEMYFKYLEELREEREAGNATRNG